MKQEDIKVPDSVVKKLIGVLDTKRIQNEVGALKILFNEFSSKSFLVNSIIKEDKANVYNQMVKDFEQKIVNITKDPNYVKAQVQEKLYGLYQELEVVVKTPLNFKTVNNHNGISIETDYYRLSKFNDNFYLYIITDKHHGFMNEVFDYDGEKITSRSKIDINKDILENIKPAYNSNYKAFKKLLDESQLIDIFKAMLLLKSYEKLFTKEELSSSNNFGKTATETTKRIESYKKVLNEHFANFKFSNYESLEKEYNDFLEVSKLQYDIEFPKVDCSEIKNVTLEFKS